MQPEIIRLYKGKDIDMLTAMSTILTNAQENQQALEKKLTNLTAVYLKDVETRLNTVIKDNLGVDNAKQLRQQTQIVYGIKKPAYTALSGMKKQIGSSYNSFFKSAQSKDTEAVINLLYQYQQNMTPDLQEELATTGIPVEDIAAARLRRNTPHRQCFTGIIQRHKKSSHGRCRVNQQSVRNLFHDVRNSFRTIRKAFPILWNPFPIVRKPFRLVRNKFITV